jgi:cytochrome c oxidase cbb3-type subunit IV
MDLNDIGIAWTVVSFLALIAIVAWVYSRGAKRGTDEASQLPLNDHLPPDDGRPRGTEKKT